MSAISLTQPTMISVLWPASGAQAWLRNLVLMVVGSLFVAASAQVQVPVWPVPFTGQTFAVLVVGMAYGSRLGAATLALYLAQGAVGLPVFADFSTGYGVLIGTTGGYLAGFVLAAGLTGYLAERGWDRSVLQTGLAMVAGNLVIYLLGLLWLGTVVGWDKPLLEWGLYPFLIGDLLKVILAAICLPLAWRLVSRLRR